MPQALPAVLAASALGVVLGVAAARWLCRTTGTRDITRRLDELEAAVTGWQDTHRARVRGRERQVTDMEIALLGAEEDAHAASLAMSRVSRDLVRRMEQVEPRLEIEVLVDQGRIPREHLPEPGSGW